MSEQNTQSAPDPWQQAVDGLNALAAAGVLFGIDLDGTITDHNTRSIVWDRATERWALAPHEEAETSAVDTGPPQIWQDPLYCPYCQATAEYCGVCHVEITNQYIPDPYGAASREDTDS